jgi:kynurenine formamidase
MLVMIVMPLSSACAVADRAQSTMPPVPREVIDLGALVTEDLPERVWGKGFMAELGYDRNNSFEVVNWDREFPNGTVSGSNAYYTLFNHGGPHVDAPNHVGLGSAGVDSFSLNDFIGPLKVIDVSRFPVGRTVNIDAIRAQDIDPGDVVIIYTAYIPPGPDGTPQRIALTREAAEYLADIPVRAFGTDEFNVESADAPGEIESDSPVARVAPNHYAFLSRGIPIYEQLFNVDQLLGRGAMYFVGVPLNIEHGDGMMVRPVVLVY